MTTRMLIDARHPEETRVAVVKGNRIEEFDFESAERRQLKGNIYLAKVTRVEPSLQAAFVDYGGNRHGFLAFSEIHPDYYQIPREDREALMREEAEHAAEEEALRSSAAERERRDEDEADAGEGDDAERVTPDEHGGHEENATEALRRKRQALRRRYKIQEVIKRRQVLLVQVVKEERGNKGAALTTYLSLAGRYCVLMPNTSHGGGISRKISNAADRKRLKTIMSELELPQSMGCIVRTAGLQRTKTEIKRDFDYLTRLWDDIRAVTLTSTAPAMIYQDSDLLKRAIRDIYNRDIDEVLVEGEEGYRAAKNFMKLLMPSHAKKVQHYVDPVPLFQRGGVEAQLAAMYNPVVQLRSGGYLVINPTEALVAIDVNSGRSTREHNIEETALKTNLEAAEEVARQLRLRDMAGLVVIDFIDMESNSNVRKVERCMKEALKNDRARIQVGRISGFGLLEMSRQRLRTGVLEASTHSCPTCNGTGLIRTTASAALGALRSLEEEAVKGRSSQLLLRADAEVAVYLLNKKRMEVVALEDRYGVAIEVVPDEEMHSSQYAIEGMGPPPVRPASEITAPLTEPAVEMEEEAETEIEDIEEAEDIETASDIEEEAAETAPTREGERRRRRRRRRRGGRGEAVAEETDSLSAHAEEEGEDIAGIEEEAAATEAEPAIAPIEDEEGRERRRRRGRRGGRRRARGGDETSAEQEEVSEPVVTAEAEPIEQAAVEPADVEAAPAPVAVPAAPEPAIEVPVTPEPAAETEAETEAPRPKTRRRPRARKVAEAAGGEAEIPPVAEPTPEPAAAIPAPSAEAEAQAEVTPAKPRRSRRKATAAADAVEAETGVTATAETTPPKPRRSRSRKTTASAVEEGAPSQEAEAPAIDTPSPKDAAALISAAETGTEPAPAAKSETETANSSDTTEAAPAPRRGWWQRTFGG